MYERTAVVWQQTFSEKTGQDKIDFENSCDSLNLSHEPGIADDLLAVVNCC